MIATRDGSSGLDLRHNGYSALSQLVGQFTLQSAARGGRDVIALQTNGDVPCSEGDLVEAEMLRRRGHMGKTARVIANLGPSDSPGAFSALALAEFDIPRVFPEEIIAETDDMKVPEVRGRTDLRDLPFVTIDGADARDFDDAVLAEPLEDGGGKSAWPSPMSPITYAPILNLIGRPADGAIRCIFPTSCANASRSIVE